MYFPSISPDGKQLVVVTGDDNSATLQLIDLDTHKARTLSAGTRGEVHWVKSH
jgi:Tol biopolymer transport system component